jgi:hypothetical protein
MIEVMRTRPIIWAVLAAAVLTACSPGSRVTMAELPRPGSSCTVQFRRDVLGVAGQNVVAPRTDVFNGAETGVHGRLKRVTGEWIVLEANAEEIWIPKSLVLLIRSAAD